LGNGERGGTRIWGRRVKRRGKEDLGTGLHHPAIKEEENSYSQREYGSLKDIVSGMKNVKANAIAQKATNQIRFLKILGIFSSQLTNHSISLMAKKTISRQNERSEVASLRKIMSKIFLLLVFS